MVPVRRRSEPECGRARIAATAVRAVGIIWCSVAIGCATGDAALEVPGSSDTSAGSLGTSAPVAATTPSAAIIDSARPMATLIARFQAGLPRVDGLTNGAATREALVRSLLEALARQDTAAVADLFVSRAEFAHLYFPTSALARPPYELDPSLAWFQLSSESERGIRRTLARLGGRRLAYVDHICAPDRPAGQSVTIWRRCTIRWREAGSPTTRASLFEAIVEHDGRFKFFSYASTF